MSAYCLLFAADSAYWTLLYEHSLHTYTYTHTHTRVVGLRKSFWVKLFRKWNTIICVSFVWNFMQKSVHFFPCKIESHILLLNIHLLYILLISLISRNLIELSLESEWPALWVSFSHKLMKINNNYIIYVNIYRLGLEPWPSDWQYALLTTNHWLKHPS